MTNQKHPTIPLSRIREIAAIMSAPGEQRRFINFVEGPNNTILTSETDTREIGAALYALLSLVDLAADNPDYCTFCGGPSIHAEKDGHLVDCLWANMTFRVEKADERE